MNLKKSKAEIEAEVTALRSLVPIGPHARRTKVKIEVAIEELTVGVDRTADEWSEMTDDEQDAVNEAWRWKEGECSNRPSEGWGNLVQPL